MERNQKILSGIDLASKRGVEIGALFNPIVKKSDGDITYVDHVDTETLLKKYAADPNVPNEKIVAVDAVWGEKTLLEAVGGGFDYVATSHVIEHVPDLVTWLNELLAVLKPGGELRFAIPDKRYTFDHLRNLTVISDVLAAYSAKARVPQPRAVIDHYAFFSTISIPEAAAGRYTPPDRPHDERLFADLMSLARQSAEGVYHDVHCWVFTPESFARLMGDIVAAGLVPVECTLFHDTAEHNFEFFVGMRRCDDLARAAASWRALPALAAPHPMAGAPSPDDAAAHLAAVEAATELAREEAATELTREKADLEQAVSTLRREKAELEEQLSAVLSSSSWRLLGPVRRAVQMVRGT